MLSDFEGHPVLVPDDCWLRNALGFTVYRDGIITRYCGVDGMLNDSWNLEGCKEEKKLLAKNVSFRFLPRHVHNLVLNLIKLKVLFSVLQALFPLEHPFIPDSLSHNQIMDFQLRRLPNRQNTKWH